MDPEGMVNACTTNVRMTRARRIAMAMASTYSRTSDLRRGVTAASEAAAGNALGLLGLQIHAQLLSTDRNASWGTSTLPTCFMRFLPSF